MGDSGVSKLGSNKLYTLYTNYPDFVGWNGEGLTLGRKSTMGNPCLS